MLAVPIQAIPVDSDQYIWVSIVPGRMTDCKTAIVRPRISYGCTGDCVSILIGCAIVILLN